MYKNRAGQKLTLLAIDTASNTPKVGDAANLTAYVKLYPDGAVTQLADTTATEVDAVNAKGLYDFDLARAETNADKAVYTGKSSTPGVVLIPVTEYPTSNIAGPGADEVTVRTLIAGEPEPGMDVWITDLMGAIVAGMEVTDSLGEATFMLDAGASYLLWAQKPGVNPIRGEEFVAVAD